MVVIFGSGLRCGSLECFSLHQHHHQTDVAANKPETIDTTVAAAAAVHQNSVRPRWPYDMRPLVRAEKYIRDASG